MSTITIGCRLPTGMVLEVAGKAVTLAGQRQTHARSKIIILTPDDYGTTEVDESFWAAWKSQVGEDFAPLKSGAIFEAKNDKEAAAKVKDLKQKKTGLEGSDQASGGVSKMES